MPSKLKLSIGYQLPDLRRIADVVEDFAEDIDEVYFPWQGVANGRGVSIANADEQKIMERELTDIHARGVRLNMLWNANCYGGKSISCELERGVGDAISGMQKRIGIEAITTASLFVASCVKRLFPNIEVRASVNMGIGSVTAMKCVQDYFDSFYIRRDLNRFPEKIFSLREWSAANGKRIYLLANSGCLQECPAHVFHDNLVSHEEEIAREDSPWCGFKGVCWDYYSNTRNHPSFLADSTWIRPEEIESYCDLVDGIKLATRTHRDPELVVSSYARRSFSGNTLSLCEPDFSSLCHLDNSKFSVSWLERFGSLPDAARQKFCKEEFKNVRC